MDAGMPPSWNGRFPNAVTAGNGSMSQIVREKCIRRESNPGNKLGRLES